MAIGTVATAGQLLRFAGTFQSVESLTQSTSTSPQAISIYTDVTVLGMGTATGAAVRNLYTLAAGVEGQEKWVYANATGEASVIFTQIAGRLWHLLGAATATAIDQSWASATGQYVLQAADEYLHLKFMNDAWAVLAARGATLATVT